MTECLKMTWQTNQKWKRLITMGKETNIKLKAPESDPTRYLRLNKNEVVLLTYESAYVKVCNKSDIDLS